MLRNFIKNRKAQNTAEYALLIALVVAGVIAMQTYAQRALQARVRDASIYMTQQGLNANVIGNTAQYEPYYLTTNYQVNSVSQQNERLGQGTEAMDSTTNRQRMGSQGSSYNGPTTP